MNENNILCLMKEKCDNKQVNELINPKYEEKIHLNGIINIIIILKSVNKCIRKLIKK